MEIKDVSYKLLCNACLCVGRNVRVISNEKVKKYYMDALNEIPLCKTTEYCPVVCWECEAFLKKAVLFREQVQDSYRILQTYTNENLHECLLTDVSRPSRLKIINNQSIDIDSTNDDDEKEDLQVVFLKNELKNDSTDCDLEDSIDQYQPLSGENDTRTVGTENCVEEKKRRSARKTKRVRKIDKSPQEKKNPEECLLPEISKTGGDRETNLELVLLKNEVNSDWDNDDVDHTNQIHLLEDEIADIEAGIENREKEEKKNDVQNKERKAKNNKSPKNSKTSKSKSTDRQYVTIELSHEEMMEERQREASRESYLKAKFKCETCIIGFNYSRAYRHHVVGRHAPGIGDYICPICMTIIASVESFTAHYKRHTRRFECSLCQKRTPDRGRIKQHLYAAHSMAVSSIKCKKCGHISNSLDDHIHHLDTHRGRFKCPDCVKTFKHRGGLKNHVIAVHELNNNFPCAVCGKVFRWKNSLKRHLEGHETKKESAVAHCDSCDISFKSVCSYQRHMRNSLKHVSQDQRKYVCDECGRRFIDKTKLRDHIEDKHLHKTYQCHICHKSSKNRVNLDQHIRNVHKGRPNNKICHHCGKGFPTKVQLESHVRTHTGERPFICEYCPTTFTQKSNLYKHYRQVHLNIKSKRYPLCKKRKDESSQLGEDLGSKLPMDPYKPVAVLRYSPERGFVM